MTLLGMHPSDLVEWLKRNYDLPGSITCQLLRAYTNDVYVVRTPDRRFVLKIYRATWRTEGEIGYEVALLQHLSAGGLKVAGPIEGVHGFVSRIQDERGNRNAVLFEYAAGEKPQPPFTPELYFAFGRAIARMHALSHDFVSEYPRTRLDLDYLIDAPLSQALPLLAEPTDRAFLLQLANLVKDRITGLAAQGLEWGPIHGDATLDNLHVTAEGEVILYDFDSGGPGWRAADLQGWAIHWQEHREKWDAYHAGYSSVRQLDEVNILAAPYLTVAWDIWGIKIDLDHRILRQGQEKMQAYLSEQVAFLRQRCELCLLPLGGSR